MGWIARLTSSVLLLGLVLLVGSSVRAGGFHVALLGTRRTSMLTNVGNPDDVTALLHNPAGLALQPGTRLHLSSGLALLKSNMKLKELDPQRFPYINEPGCGEGEAPPCAWPLDAEGYYERQIEPESYVGLVPYVGASQDLSLFGGTKEIVVSLAAYAPGAYGGAMPEDAPSAYFITDALFLVVAATAGVGWKLNDHFALGASLSYNYMRLKYARRMSTIDVMTPRGEIPGLPAAVAQETFGDLSLSFEGMDHGFGWGLGALVSPTSWLSFGASYNGFTSARFEGDLELTSLGTSRGVEPMDSEELRTTAGALGFKLPRRLEVEMPVPPSFLAGVSVRPTPWLEVGLDLRLFLYTLYKKQVLRPLYDEGDKGIEPLSEDSLSQDKGYHNSWAVAVGILIRPFRDRTLDVMLGGSYDRSPVPNRTFTIDNPSMNQVALATGLRWQATEGLRLGVSYMLITYLERDVRNSQTSPPTNVRVSNTSHIPSIEAEYAF